MIFHTDKASWGPGPWQDEPDHLNWIDEATNLDCMINRGPMGGLCGYVGVPPEHPCHGADYYGGWDNPGPADGLEVHGGLTYAAACQEDGEICHVPEAGRPADVWWFGFDCGHYMDLLPHMAVAYPKLVHEQQTYKTIGYVKGEIAHLAEQLAALA